jgi:hypothetical protein
MDYLSTKLIDKLQEDTGVKFTLCSRRKMQKSIRDYFIKIHEEAIEATEIAKNKSNYVQPNFYDK